MAHTRVYFKGELEAEGFPVADVSEHLPGPTRSCGSTCAARRRAARARRRARAARARRRGRPRRHQRPKLDHYETHLFLVCHAVRAGRRRRPSCRRPRSTPSSATAGSSPCARTTASRWSRCCAAGTARPTSSPHGVSFLLYGLLDVVVDGYFETVAGVRRLLRRGQRGIFAERPARSARAAPLVRDAAGARAVPPPRRADARGGEQPDAARARGRRPRRSTRTSRTCTTTSCGSASRPTRCATSSARSSRPTSACATTARTR